LRELVALDQRLAGLPLPRDIVNASRRVGYAQLERLRALRDQRVLQRYRRAVERGEAHGWHTLVYGLGLHVYSLPLRQGLMSYTRQTLGSFVGSAAHSLGLPQGKSQEILMGLLIATAKAVDELLAVNGFAQVRLAGTRP
jgi:urease accessory protein UreF